MTFVKSIVPDLPFIPLLLSLLMIFQACSTSTDPSDDTLFNEHGTLKWGGAPALDGAGMLFAAEDTTYGAPGNRDNYTEYFPEGKNEVQIRADIKITGETTVRGWGVTYPEIEFLNISVIDEAAL